MALKNLVAIKGLTAELVAMRRHAELTERSIRQIARNLDDARQRLWKVVDGYNAKRVELLKEKFREHRTTWCTCCFTVFPESETELMFFEGREAYSHGYQDSCYGFRSFAQLYRVCPTCSKEASDRHGTSGAYDTIAKDRTSFSAFLVEKREDGYYANKFGRWIKLDDKQCKLIDLSDRLVDELAKKWSLLPRIEIKSEKAGFNWRERLIIHESAGPTIAKTG